METRRERHWSTHDSSVSWLSSIRTSKCCIDSCSQINVSQPFPYNNQITFLSLSLSLRSFNYHSRYNFSTILSICDLKQWRNTSFRFSLENLLYTRFKLQLLLAKYLYKRINVTSSCANTNELSINNYTVIMNFKYIQWRILI